MSSGAVVDTNVVVAGILTRDPAAPTARILDGMLQHRFVFVLSELLLSEYRAVLMRPRIRERHGLDSDSVDQILTRLALEAIVVEQVSMSAMVATDSGDQFLWNLLSSVTDPILVTGDERLRTSTPPSGRVMSPAEFCEFESI